LLPKALPISGLVSIVQLKVSPSGSLIVRFIDSVSIKTPVEPFVGVSPENTGALFGASPPVPYSININSSPIGFQLSPPFQEPKFSPPSYDEPELTYRQLR